MSTGFNAMTAAGGASSLGKPVSLGGGGGNSLNTVGGTIAVGVPVYTAPSGNFAASVGVATNFGKGVPSNPGVGVGFKWNF